MKSGADLSRRNWGCALIGAALIVFVLPLMILMIVIICSDTGWSGEHPEIGPLPLTSPEKQIVRLVNRSSTFEMTYKELRWDVGDGPIQPEDRIKPLIESIPKELMIRMRATKKIPAKYYYGDHSKDHGHDGMDLIDQPAYDVSGVVISLNPDVMIVCFRERKYGPQPPSNSTWDGSLRDKARSDYIDSRLESIRHRDATFEVNVGTLLRWSEEMYVISTDPLIGCRRVKFENDQDVINFRTGKLSLRHHDEDVDVSRD